MNMFSILWLKWLFIIVGGCGALLACHKVLLWMEERGWIYYHKKKPKPGTVANAWLELQSFIEPSRKHVVQVVQEEREEPDVETARHESSAMSLRRRRHHGTLRRCAAPS